MDYWVDWHQTWLAIDIDLDQGIKLDNHHILRWANLRPPGGHLSPAVIQGDDEDGGPESLAWLHISKLVRWQSVQSTEHQQVISALQSREMLSFNMEWLELQCRDVAEINKIYQTI